MTVAEALREATAVLAAAGVPEPDLDAGYLLSYLTDSPRLMLLACGETPLTSAREAAFFTLIARRAQREPLQYIIGNQVFMGHTFSVSRGVLIPRMDTEALCEQAILRLKGTEDVLDLCTGSGAIGLSVKKALPSCHMTLSDLSEEALCVARQNAYALHADVKIVQGDMLSPFGSQTFDMILCNPPYIREGDRENLQEEVRFEPESALFAGEDGLNFYHRLAFDAPAHIRENGFLICEVGDGEMDAVRKIFAPVFKTMESYRDLCGNERVIVCGK